MTQKQAYWYALLRFLLTCGAIAVSPLPAVAQRIPIADDTLGNERSQVTPFNPAIDVIDGGARRGVNLFHSFRDFNVDVGRGVYFSNPAGVVNILTRVTGGNPSQIFGFLGVLGNANLFLINPNGILFGPGTQLDIRGGSFVASTANSILFNNGFAFSATNPQAPPLLTVNIPIGLQYGSNPGAIQVQGAFLEVSDGQTLTLTGGAVTVDDSVLFAPGGRVELAGVGDVGEVGLTQQGQEWRLSVPDGLARADVALENGAIVAVNAGGGGNVAITARNLTVMGSGTQVQATILPNLGTVSAQVGDIDINATEAISINESSVINSIQRGSTGNAGNINITTGTLSLTNGGLLIANTAGRGNAGNITITARDAVSFDGVGNRRPSAAVTQVGSRAIGRGGDITITTGKLSLTNGGTLSSTTFGRGDAGNITITASDHLSFDGVGSNGQTSSAFSNVETRAIGKGGDITITTGTLSFTNGGTVSAVSFGQGDAGNITITARDRMSLDGGASTNDGFIESGVYAGVDRGVIGQGGNIHITTGSLFLTDGGTVRSEMQGQGKAGNITLTARDVVSLDGGVLIGDRTSSSVISRLDPTAIGQGGDISITASSFSITNGAFVSASTRGRGDAGNITITASDRVSFDGATSAGFGSGAFSAVESGAVGQGGSITVKTGLFSIANGGVLTASSTGEGRAGNLDVNARQLRLDNQGRIVAETASGQGGNITLQVSDLLLLRRGSFISTTAGTAQAGGDGGNITFNGKFIVAVPTENSDITANAFTGSGGRVNINAQGLFGIQFRPQLTPLSDITASSTFGIAGTVAINTPNVDPNRGLVQLPVDLTDASRLIVQECPTGDSLAKPPNQFIITGRGGLPPTPSEAMNRDAIQVDLVTADVEDAPSISQNQPSLSSLPPHLSTPPPSLSADALIVEAQGLQVAADGTVSLVAAAPTHEIAKLGDRLIHCR